MKINNKKFDLSFFLNEKDKKYKLHFEDTFIKYFSISRSDYFNNFDHISLSKEEFKKINKIIKYELKNIDTTFLYKFKWFYDEKFLLKRKVFVPQPDTEGLIELALSENLNNKDILEIGSGTGIIPIILAKHTNSLIDSFDLNKNATHLSEKNYYLKLPILKGKVNFINEDFTKYFFSKKYDIIISNPPYLDKKDGEISNWVKKHQPKLALYPPKNELFYYEEIFKLGKKVSKRDLIIFLEIGYKQKEALDVLLKKFNFKSYFFYKDISNNDRYLKIYV